MTADEQAKLAAAATAKGLESWQQKLAEALTALQKTIGTAGAQPVYVSGGKAYRLAADGKVTAFAHEAARPYAWKLAHDVRPARMSLGIKGCYECHAAGTPIFAGQVTSVAAAPVAEPVRSTMLELAGYDKTKMDAWNASFQGRTAFKWFGFGAVGVASLVLLSYACAGILVLPGLVKRGSDRQ